MSKKCYSILVITFVSIGFLLIGLLPGFAIPPIDVSAKIGIASDDSSQSPIRGRSEAYSTNDDTCDAKCMEERARGERMYNSVMPQQYNANANSVVTFNTSDLQAVKKYFPTSDQNYYVAQGVVPVQPGNSTANK